MVQRRPAPDDQRLRDFADSTADDTPLSVQPYVLWAMELAVGSVATAAVLVTNELRIAPVSVENLFDFNSYHYHVVAVGTSGNQRLSWFESAWGRHIKQ